MTIFIVIVYACLFFMDPFGLWKRKLKREAWVCSGLWLLSFLIAFAMGMDWNIPSPSPFIVNLVKALY